MLFGRRGMGILRVREVVGREERDSVGDELKGFEGWDDTE